MNQELFRSSVQALLAGRATSLQKDLIEKAMQDPVYRELYFTLSEEWENQNPQLMVDSDGAFQKWRAQISEVSEAVRPVKSSNSGFRRSWLYWAAAACFILLGGGFFRDELLNKTYQTGYGELKTFYLGDGTRVTMNANSSLTLPRFGFGKRERSVFLDGEAEFAVIHQPDNTSFKVFTPDGMEVKVLGTEFVVYSRKKGSKVALTKGKVQLRLEKQAEPLTMVPGDVVTVSSEGEVVREPNQPVENYSAWKYHRFTFENTRISSVADQLHDVFGVNVIIADSALAKRTVGGTFQADSAEKVLEVLAEILEARVILGPAPRTYTLSY